MRMSVASLQRQMRSGASNFYWIAALSMGNSLFFFFSTRSSFVVGLGITQFLDTIVYNIAQSYPNSIRLIRGIGLVPDFFICSVFVLCGFLAGKGHRWGFIAGMILYSLDAILTLVSPDLFGFGFHLFFLWFLFSGLQAFNALKKLNPEVTSNSPISSNLRK
jgi:hypothetical protein